jgi:hypothetical protein
MQRLQPLPQSLSYLNPVRKQLAALAAEDLNEDMDPSVFRSTLCERIAGLAPDQARERLRADAAELQEWLSQTAQEDRLHFALGFLAIASESPEKFLTAPSERQAEHQVRMQFPEGAKTKRHFQGWKIRWNGFTVWVLPCDQTSFQREIQGFQEPVGQYAALIAVAVLPVHFGAAHGVKRIETTAELGTKHAKYALEVPGGCALVAVMKKGLKWEESEVEQWFSTIQILKSHESAA